MSDNWRQRFIRLIQKHKEVTSDRVDTPCWEWMGWRDDYGYGRFSFPRPGDGHSRRHAYAHRLSYQIKHGKLPEGIELDHLCYHRWCVNPQHLEQVTHAENIRRRTEKDRERRQDYGKD